MASSITTDTTLLASGLITANEKRRLTPPDAAAFPNDAWDVWHELAWTEILNSLATRADPIAEADLSDTSELEYAAHCYVIFLAFQVGGNDRAMSGKWHDKWVKVMNQTQLTLSSGATAPQWGRAITIGRA